MNYFVLWFFKITAFVPQLFFYRRKTVRLTKKRQSVKGAIIISNHYSVYDMPFIMFTFFFRTIYFVAGEQLYKKRMLGWWVRVIGGIRCNRDIKDMTWLDTCEKLLKKGKTILIFPQSRLSPDNSVDFNQNYAVLALRSRCPVLPVYVNGKYGKRERARIIIGKKTDINELWDAEQSGRKNIEDITLHFRKLINEFEKIADDQQRIAAT